MLDILKLDQRLLRRELGFLPGLVNATKFYGIILALLVIIKYLTTLPPNTFPVKELFALVVAFMGIFKIRTNSINKKQIKMITFFPMFSTETIKWYFLYKKPVLVYGIILYLLFPINTSEEEILSFFFFLSIILLMMFIDTLSDRLFANSAIPNRVNTAIRIGYFGIFSPNISDKLWGFDLYTLVMSQKLWYLVLISLFLALINPFILVAPNRKFDLDD